MFVEREVAFVLVILDLVLFERGQARQDEQLVLTAIAVLAVVFVERTTGLAKHECAD